MKTNNIYIKKIFNVLAANLVNFCCSVIITLILPKIISISDYGEWQYFLLIFTYIEICQFGFANGVYLRFGGLKLEELNLGLLKKQISFIIVTLVIFSCALLYFQKPVSLSSIGFIICIPIMAWRFFVDYLLQSTGRTDEYSKIIIYDKSIFILLMIISYFMGNNFGIKNIIDSFIIGKLIISIYSMLYIKKLLFADMALVSFKECIHELWLNIRVGSKLLFATVSSLLIVGVIRFSIVDNLGKTDYGKVAIVLSVCSFAMLLINAASIVLFPSLRNLLNQGVNINKYYESAYLLFNILALCMLLCAYPLAALFKYWLTQYYESIKFIFILLPVIIFDSNWAIWGSTILKVYRKENDIFKITNVSLICSILFSTLLTQLIDDVTLEYFVWLIPLVLSIRFIYTEKYINKIIGVNLQKYNIYILWSIVLFITLNNIFSIISSCIIYIGYLVIGVYLYKAEIIKSYRVLRDK